MADTAMSASFLHKEIEINHNGVHYKVAVDAEGQHDTDHSVTKLEKDPLQHDQDELAKIGIHYELPDTEHLHHHDEEDKHHGVVIHIDLGGAHDAIEEHIHDEGHHSQEHQEEHLVAVHPHHNVDQYHYATENHNLNQHVHPDLGHHDLEHDHIYSYEDLKHLLLAHHDSEEYELGNNKIEVPHEKKQDYVVGHQKGNLWHFFNLRPVKPVRIHSDVPHSEQTELENGYELGDINKQPVVELHGLHHHVDVHH